MAWNIDVVTNEMKLSKKQATKLVDILENTWNEYETYIEWVGEKDSLIPFFMAMEFVDDFYEHKDHLSVPAVQAALLAVGAEGFVTFADFEGDSKGHAWTHTFKAGKYTYAFGKVRQMVDGRMPDSLVEVPQVTQEEIDVLTAKAPFQGNIFVITGTMNHISREFMEDAISRMGGKTSKSLSGKTEALIIGAEPGPSKILDAAKRGTPVWNEEIFLLHAGLLVADMETDKSEVPASQTNPFGWYFEEFDLTSQSIVQTGFFRDGTTVEPKSGCGLRKTALFTQ